MIRLAENHLYCEKYCEVIVEKDDYQLFVKKKVHNFRNIGLGTSLENECEILKQLNHRNIVHLIDYSIDRIGDSYEISMEYCKCNTLRDFIDKLKFYNAPLLSEESIMQFFIQICEGLQYLHLKNIAHRDLKLENLFLTSSFEIVIGDVGISSILTNSNDTYIFGTDEYLAPEIFFLICIDEYYDPLKADIWALGIILIELCTLTFAEKRDWESQDELTTFYRNIKLDNSYHNIKINIIDNIITSTEKRYNIIDIINNGFYQSYLNQDPLSDFHRFCQDRSTY